MHPVLTACPECDLLHRIGELPKGGIAFCSRCGGVLRRARRGSIDTPLAFAVTALVLFVLANGFPLMSLTMNGTRQEVTLPGCIQCLALLGWPWLAAILITLVELAPLAFLVGVTHVLLQVKHRRAHNWTARIFRLVLESQSWGMVEVFLLAIMVSYVKLSKMAMVLPGPSLYALAAFIVAVSALLSSLEPEAVWEAMGQAS